MAILRKEIVTYLDKLLEIKSIKDSSCNGLQVQGVANINRVAVSVDACMAVYKKAVAKKCDMLIVHHGLIWNGITSITGPVYEQVSFLIQNGLNVYGAHLPLDMHHTLGNNMVLAQKLMMWDIQKFGFYKNDYIGYVGELPKSLTLEELGTACATICGGRFSTLPFGKKKIKTVAIVSGGGSDAIPEAVDKGIDCFITGESSHQNHHLALEGKLNVLYLGHYHSETLGVKALGEDLKKVFDVEVVFIDEPTLV